MCRRAIYIFPGSVYIFPPAEQADPSWEYIIRLQTNECGNWDWGHDIPFLRIFVSNFRHFVFAVWWVEIIVHPFCHRSAYSLSSPTHSSPFQLPSADYSQPYSDNFGFLLRGAMHLSRLRRAIFVPSPGFPIISTVLIFPIRKTHTVFIYIFYLLQTTGEK